MNRQTLKLHRDLVARYRRIADLWVAYNVKSEDGPEVYGREFYHAVGELLQGIPMKRLELHHIRTSDVEPIVHIGRSEEE